MCLLCGACFWKLLPLLDKHCLVVVSGNCCHYGIKIEFIVFSVGVVIMKGVCLVFTVWGLFLEIVATMR